MDEKKIMREFNKSLRDHMRPMLEAEARRRARLKMVEDRRRA